jgi:fumarylacetoacetase
VSTDPFGVHNLPYCAFGSGLGVRVGDRVLDLSGLETAGLLDARGSLSGETTLNRFMAQGRPLWTEVRGRLVELVENRTAVEPFLRPLADVRLTLPFEVADYVDFYSSEHHAMNVSKILRPESPRLQPNWRHLPVGYHGRAGTVVVSGTPVKRPSGQRREPGSDLPTFGPSVRLDIEAEVGFVVGDAQKRGPLSPDEFADRVFGVVLLNDWSARDIQAWEYQPLGPFLGKSFATSVSPFVVPLDALTAARIPAPVQDPPVLPYLVEKDRRGYDIRVEVRWNGTVVSRPPFSAMYWTPAQQLAHLTVNGAWVRTGDLYASGTVSGARRDEVGSFIELTWNGAEPVRLDTGEERAFLRDGDTVTITATAPGPDGSVIGFGEVTGTVVPL